MVKRIVIPPVLLVLCAAALPLVFIHGGFLNTWEYLAYDVLCRSLLVEDEVSDRVALIMIDTVSLDFGTEFHDQYDYLEQKGIVEGKDMGGEYGARTLFLWPWKRSAYEIIIDFLARGGARVIAFDMVFSTPHPSGMKDSDDSLGVSTLMHNEEGLTYVIHTINFHESEQVPENRRMETRYERQCLEAASLRIEGIETSPFLFNRSDGGFYYAPILPYKAILEDTLEAFDGGKGLLRLGAVAVQQDPDAVIRRARVVTQYKNWNLPSLGLAATLAFLESGEGGGDVGLRVGGSGLTITRLAEGESTRIPLTPSGDILVHYKDSGPEGYEGSSRFRTYPAYRILLSAMNNTRLIEELGFDPETFRVDPAVFKNMIVFVGANALGLYDLKATPVSENYPGVKVHAAVAENLLDGNPLRRMAAPGRGAIAALLALVTILATLTLKKTSLKVLITAAVILLYALIVVALFTHGLIWIDTIIPLVGVIIAYTGGTTYNYFTEGRQKREITRMFQHYVPASVVNRLVRNPEGLNTKGERVEITVFFSDIRGIHHPFQYP